MSQIDYIDSDYRLSGTSSNFLYNVKKKPTNSLCVLSANIPKSYYLIQEGNNQVIFTENGMPRTVTIPKGNYSLSDFIGVLVVLLNPGQLTYTEVLNKVTQVTTYTATGGTPTGALVYILSTNKYTSLITYTATGGTFNSVTFPSTSSLYRQLGFEYESVNPVTGNVITSPNLPLFQLTNIILIRSNICRCPSTNIGGDILQSITAVNNPNMSSITYQNTTNPHLLKKQYTGEEVCTFYITDADGFILDLGGSPINIEILFFDYDDTPQVLRQQALLDNFDKLAKTTPSRDTRPSK